MMVSSILLLMVWIILNGLSVGSLVLGIFIVSTIQFLRYRLGHIIKYPFNFKIVSYFLWLIREIFFSALKVVRIIWRYPQDFSPGFCKITTTQTTDAAKVLYANSITLTPGTFTVDIGSKLLVHSITSQNKWDETMDNKIKEVIKC